MSPPRTVPLAACLPLTLSQASRSSGAQSQRSRFKHALQILEEATAELRELGVGVEDLAAAGPHFALVDVEPAAQLGAQLRIRVGHGCPDRQFGLLVPCWGSAGCSVGGTLIGLC